MIDVNTRQVSRRVMIEMLVVEGVTYAGWLGPDRLRATYDKHSASNTFMTGGFRTRGGRPVPFSTVHRVGYLPGDRDAARQQERIKQNSKKFWWEDL